MALPCLFPYGKGDFHINRTVTCPSLHDWAEHLLWYQDGRFARHKVWKFVVHNMIMRKRALEQSRFFVDQKLGDPHITVIDLQERLATGDTFADKLFFLAQICAVQLSTGTRDAKSFVPLWSSWSMSCVGYLHFS